MAIAAIAAASMAAVAMAAVAMAGLAATTAWAAEGEGSGDPWMDLVWKTVNFVLLVGLLYLVARKPVARMFREAAQLGKAELDEPREQARRAEADAAEQRRLIASLEGELQRLLAESREQARVEHERVVGEARQQAERIRNAVSLRMEQEFNKARKELQLELARQTVRLAEALIRERMDDRSRQRIATQAIERLGAGA